jgi:hypothetical protein
VGPAASSADAASDRATRATARATFPIPPVSRALPPLTRIWTFARRELSRPAIRDARAQYSALKRYYDLLTWRYRVQRYCTMVYDMFDSVARWSYWARHDPAVRQAYDYCRYWS